MASRPSLAEWSRQVYGCYNTCRQASDCPAPSPAPTTEPATASGAWFSGPSRRHNPPGCAGDLLHRSSSACPRRSCWYCTPQEGQLPAVDCSLRTVSLRERFSACSTLAAERLQNNGRHVAWSHGMCRVGRWWWRGDEVVGAWLPGRRESGGGNGMPKRRARGSGEFASPLVPPHTHSCRREELGRGLLSEKVSFQAR